MNDSFYNDNGRVNTRTNNSGGIQAGISNGQDIYFRVAFKPVSTILREQQTVDMHGNDTIIKARGRHDPCVLPRAVPIVEAMAPLRSGCLSALESNSLVLPGNGDWVIGEVRDRCDRGDCVNEKYSNKNEEVDCYLFYGDNSSVFFLHGYR